MLNWIKENIISLLEWIAIGIIDNSYWICLIVCMIALILYICNFKKSLKYVSASTVIFIILQALKQVILSA